MNTTNTRNYQLGDEVTALYGDLKIEGVVSAYDGSGFVYVTTKPIVVSGTERTLFALDRYQRQTMRLIRAGAPAAVHQPPAGVLGGAYLAG